MNQNFQPPRQDTTSMTTPTLEWARWSAGTNYPEEWHSKNAILTVKIRREGGRENRDRWVLQMSGVRQEFPGELSTEEMKMKAMTAYRRRIDEAKHMAA